MGQRSSERPTVVEPMRRVLRECAMQDGVHLGGQAGLSCGGARRRSLHVCHHDLGRRRPTERRPPCDQLERGARQRVLIRAGVDRLSEQLFRRRVQDGAEGHPGAGELGRIAGEVSDPEVGEQSASAAVEEDVRGFHIAVHEAGRSGVVECLSDFADDTGRFERGQRAALQRRREVLAVDVLEGDPQSTVGFASVVDLHHVRIAQARDDIGLPLEPPAELVVIGRRCSQHLECVTSWKPRVAGEKHLAHTARSEQSFDRVAGEDVPGAQLAHARNDSGSSRLFPRANDTGDHGLVPSLVTAMWSRGSEQAAGR
ncbi:hypothetical protein WKY82_04290 [Gordonia malaquae]